MTTLTSVDSSSRRMPVAFYGRTARAQTADQTDGDLASQYLTCVHALPTTALVTAVFYDLGPTNWLHPHPPENLAINHTTLRRNGGLHQLLAEAQQTQARRFDYLMTAGPDQLCRNSKQCLALVQQLRALGIVIQFANPTSWRLRTSTSRSGSASMRTPTTHVPPRMNRRASHGEANAVANYSNAYSEDGTMTAESTGYQRQRRVATTGQVDVLRSYMRCAARNGHMRQKDVTRADEVIDPAMMGALLESTTRLFDTHVVGPNRSSIVATTTSLTGRAGRQPGSGQPADLSKPLVDVAVLPTELLRQLLDAFAVEIYLDQPRGTVRLGITISSTLDLSTPTGRPLQVEVPDSWPILTPAAARALLRLFTNVANRRYQRANPPRRSP